MTYRSPTIKSSNTAKFVTLSSPHTTSNAPPTSLTIPSLRNQSNLPSLLSLNKCVCLCVLVPLQEGLQSVGPKIPRRFFKRRRVARFSRKRFFRRSRRTRRTFKSRFRRFSRRRRSRRGFRRRAFKGANRSGYWVRSSAPDVTRSTLGRFRNNYFSNSRHAQSSFTRATKQPFSPTGHWQNSLWTGWHRNYYEPNHWLYGKRKPAPSAPFYKDYSSRLRTYRLATAAKYLTPQYWIAAANANRHRLGL